MKKIYTTKYSKLKFTLERGGLKAEIEFKNGRMADNVPARFITSDKFLQYALEKDPRFGTMYRLERTIAEPSDEKKEAAPAETKPAEKKAKDVTVVETVTDLADAIDHFSTLGKVLTTEKQVRAAMKSMNIEFPNWK